MGIRERRREIEDAREGRTARDEDPEQRWEYLARNLDFTVGVALEADFNKHGAKGWEFVAVAKDYAIFKRPVDPKPSPR